MSRSSSLARPRRPGRVVAAVLAVLVLVAAAVAAVLVTRDRAAAQADRDARAAATAFAAAWQSGSPGSVPYASGAPDAVQQSYAALTKRLAGARPTVGVRGLNRDGDAATGTIGVRWTLPGGATWSYDVPLRVPAARGQVLGAGGVPLVSERPVVDVGVQPSRLKGTAGALATTLAGLLDVDAARLTKRITASCDGW